MPARSRWLAGLGLAAVPRGTGTTVVSFDALPDAVALVDEGRAVGKVVVQVGDR